MVISVRNEGFHEINHQFSSIYWWIIHEINQRWGIILAMTPAILAKSSFTRAAAACAHANEAAAEVTAGASGCSGKGGMGF